MDGNLSLNSKNAILYDNTYNKVLYEKDAYTKVPNASTTKILTAIVAYENGNIEDVVTVSLKAATVGGSGINLRSGDKITLCDLLSRTFGTFWKRRGCCNCRTYCWKC